MEKSTPSNSGSSPSTATALKRSGPGGASRLRSLILLLLTLLVICFWPSRRPTNPVLRPVAVEAPASALEADSGALPGIKLGWATIGSRATNAEATAAELVAQKVVQFGRSRRELARAIGRRMGKKIPVEVERFFDAIESGHWPDIETEWNALAHRSGQYEDSEHGPDLNLFWPTVLDAYGVAEQAHEWPAQKLLDYGHSILDALQPGMVYVGGTDSGRWIPELLNETSGSEPHLIVTQNALADNSYLDYVQTLYGDKMNVITSDESKKIFEDYVTDARRRLEHDQQFPIEPKQLRPEESIKVGTDGKTEVSGQGAVMSINEKLLVTLMQKNPDLHFAVQESTPMKGTYADAVPLGPLMELQASDAQKSFTAERAAQSLEYWQKMAQQVLVDREASESSTTLKAYSHDVASAANLLAGHNFNGEAEKAYRLATQLWPENPESAGGLADLLSAAGRAAEARQVLDEFTKSYPERQADLERVSASARIIGPGPKPKP